MGTNYYWKRRDSGTPCHACGHVREDDEGIHIGKSSAGWVFALHVYPRAQVDGFTIANLSAWIFLWSSGSTRVIVDEYGVEHTTEEMLAVIRNRAHALPITRALLDANHAVPGPNNLMRRSVGDYCVGHGEGTWDYCVGEFC